MQQFNVLYIKDIQYHSIEIMFPGPLLVAGFLLTYVLVKSNEDKSNPVQSPPVVPNPVKPPPVVATKKRALETSPEASEKKKKTEVDLVHCTRFTTADDDAVEVTPVVVTVDDVNKDNNPIVIDKSKILKAKCDQFVQISDNMFFYRVRRDGKCLFRAIVAAMYYMQDNVVELSDSTTKANDLRQKIVSFMLDNPKKFENAVTDAESLKKYCEDMMEPNEWGGFSEVFAIHVMTGMQVDIYHLVNDSLTIFESFKDHGKAGVKDVIRLFYNGKDHWDMIYMTQ
jgi:hypothetical protein